MPTQRTVCGYTLHVILTPAHHGVYHFLLTGACSSLAGWSTQSDSDKLLLPELASRLEWQREVPLPLDNLLLLADDVRSMVLGQRLHILVEVLAPAYARMLTDMLLGRLSTASIYALLFDEQAAIGAMQLKELSEEVS